MDAGEIEQTLVRTGWELDGSFLETLIIGCNGDGLSIVTYPEAARETEEPVFELIDHERNLACAVQEIPTPQQAAQLLQEHGLPAEELEDHNPL